MKIACVLQDDSIPRTYFYQVFLRTLIANPRYQGGVVDTQDVVFFPCEEISPELNWPRFGSHTHVFVRGTWDANSKATYQNYAVRFLEQPGRKCIVSMQSGGQLPRILQDFGGVFVASINLQMSDRLINPRTISMPALPITVGKPSSERKWLATFRGHRSHECRDAVAALHNDNDIICEVLAKQDHLGKLDALTGAVDDRYVELLSGSTFALVPRGDANFSYRLMEALSFGCIPVIISDDWVLPFDRSVHWPDISLRIAEAEVESIPTVLRALPNLTVDYMRRKLIATYEQCFASPEIVFENLLRELEHVIPFA